MGSRLLRVFLDTSALIAGVISPSGAAREVLRICEAGAVEVLLSRQVLVEADRNFSEKFPKFISDYRLFIKDMSPILVEDPPLRMIKEAAHLIHYKDAPILAAAMMSDVDYLVTWNTRHFQKNRALKAVTFEIVTPGEFLKKFLNFVS